MKKQLFTLLFCSAVSVAGAQSNKAIHEAAKAPDRAAQSARADLYVQDKTRISDEAPVAKKKSAKAPKKNACGAKCCRKKEGKS
jgi:hypothetical protein